MQTSKRRQAFFLHYGVMVYSLAYTWYWYKGFYFVTHEVGGRLQSDWVGLDSLRRGAVDIT